MSRLVKQFQKLPMSNRLVLVVSLLASLLTLAQVALLVSDQDGLCFSSGCEIVDSLTTIPPIYFNIGGFLFFQVLFWGTWLDRKRQEWQDYLHLIMLAGLGAEGVLVSFQHFVIETFCTYCLVIFSLVVLLNFLAGIRQVFLGAAVFIAILVAFSTLQFSSTTDSLSSIAELDTGTYAILPGEDSQQKHTLFFASTCPHCEDVIESMKQGITCAIRFNPIDQIPAFPLAGVIKSESYDVEVNKTFLKSLDRNHVPILLVEQQRRLQMISGGGSIKAYLNNSCRPTPIVKPQGQNLNLFAPPAVEFEVRSQDDSCEADVDCDDPSGESPAHD